MTLSRNSLFARVVAIYIILFIWAQRCAGAPGPRPPMLWPDYEQLIHESAVTLQPSAVVLAIAWVESREDTNPHLRATYCWNKQRHEPDCEVGRFQIKPSTARFWCPGLDIFTTLGNHTCFFRLLEYGHEHYGPEGAITWYHHGAPADNVAYLVRVEHVIAYIGLVTVESAPRPCLWEPRS